MPQATPQPTPKATPILLLFARKTLQLTINIVKITETIHIVANICALTCFYKHMAFQLCVPDFNVFSSDIHVCEVRQS